MPNKSSKRKACKIAKPFTACISLFIIGLMLVVPFLYYYHALPIASFYQEGLTALIGLCAMPLLLTSRYWSNVEIPRIVLLPIGLMTLAIVQYCIGIIDHLDTLLIMSFYMVFAVLLMMIGHRLKVELGAHTVVVWLAVFLLIGAELNAAIGLIQHYLLNPFTLQFITSKSSIVVYGNVAQANHYAAYVSIGLVSLWLLSVQFSMRWWKVALLASPLLFVIILSGSRSGALYVALIACVAYFWRNHLHTWRKLALWGGLLAIISFVAYLSIFGVGDSIRLNLWKDALVMFSHNPLFGSGLGQFAYQHFNLSAELKDAFVVGLYNNAHNLPLQIMVEFGLIGLVVLIVPLILWICKAHKPTVYHLWGYAILAILGIHSLLEYPLWYMYFVGIAALLLGMFDATIYKLNWGMVGRVALLCILTLYTLSMVLIYDGYKHLELSMALRKFAATDNRYFQPMQQELYLTYENVFMRSYAELYSATLVTPDENRTGEKIALSDRSMHFIPVPQVALNQVLMLSIQGRPEEAKELLERVKWSFPAEYKAMLPMLENLAQKYPDKFGDIR